MTRFENALRKANYPEIVKENELDIWICLYFKVLPTDEKYKQLSYEQKLLLFVGYLEQPLPEKMKRNYEEKESGQQITKTDEENFKRLGYSDKALANIKRQMREAGLME